VINSYSNFAFQVLNNTESPPQHDPSLVLPKDTTLKGLAVFPNFLSTSEHDDILAEVKAVLRQANPPLHPNFHRRYDRVLKALMS
jgi:hypothetical protein